MKVMTGNNRSVFIGKKHMTHGQTHRIQTDENKPCAMINPMMNAFAR